MFHNFLSSTWRTPKRKLSELPQSILPTTPSTPIGAARRIICSCIDIIEVVGFIGKFVMMLIYLICAVGCWVYFFQGIRKPSVDHFTIWFGCTVVTLLFRIMLKKTTGKEMKQVTSQRKLNMQLHNRKTDKIR